MIEVEHLNKAYPMDGRQFKAVDDASLSIKQGEFLSILGHSGSGKTTLLNLIGGLTKPNSGTVRIDGQDIWLLSDSQLSELRNEKMNFIFQFSSLIPTLNVVDNVLLPLALCEFLIQLLLNVLYRKQYEQHGANNARYQGQYIELANLPACLKYVL